MKMKVEALGAFKLLKDPIVIEGIQVIVSEYHVRNGKEWNDGSKGEIRMSPGQLCDLLAFMATPVDVPESVSVSRDTEESSIGESNEQNQENGSNFVPIA